MMPLVVAGTAARASTMLTAAMATRANSVMRLRTGACDALEVPNCMSRFIIRNPPMLDENELAFLPSEMPLERMRAAMPQRRNLFGGGDDCMTFVQL